MVLNTRPDDRGQMIIVAAIGLAILLTLLTVTLNTALLGEIHAAETDGGLQEERGALQYQYSVERGVSGLLVSINREYDGYEPLERELDDAVGRWSELTREEQIRDGKTTDASLVGVIYETRIEQNESSAFTDQRDRTAWTLAENTSGVREFEMDIHASELVETSDCTDAEGCFSLRVEGSDGESWELFVHDHGGVAITVELASGENETYGPAGSSTKLNVTDGVFDVDGSGTEFTTFLDDELAAPYTLTYKNANNVDGTYGLTVEGKIVDETIEDDERYGVDGSPNVAARIAAADVRVQYRSADLIYETETEIVPGETDD